MVLAEVDKIALCTFTKFLYRSYLDLQLSPSFSKDFRPGLGPETDGLD